MSSNQNQSNWQSLHPSFHFTNVSPPTVGPTAKYFPSGLNLMRTTTAPGVNTCSNFTSSACFTSLLKLSGQSSWLCISFGEVLVSGRDIGCCAIDEIRGLRIAKLAHTRPSGNIWVYRISWTAGRGMMAFEHTDVIGGWGIWRTTQREFGLGRRRNNDGSRGWRPRETDRSIFLKMCFAFYADIIPYVM